MGGVRALAMVVTVVALTHLWQRHAVPAIECAAGFIAKRECSARWVARTGAAAREEFAIPVFAWLPLGVRVDENAHVAHVDRWAQAAYHETTGCVLGSLPAWAPTCSLPPPAPAAPLREARDAAVQALLDARLGARLSDGTPINARGLVVLRDGALVAEAYRAPAYSRDTPQAGWSMTKSVLAWLLGKRIAAGHIGLDDAVHMPGRATTPPQLRLRHLLDMASGLDFVERYGPGGDPTMMLFGSLHDVAGFGANRSVAYTPGTHWVYSSYDSNLLAHNLLLSFGGDSCALLRWMRTELPSFVVETDTRGLPVFSSFGWAPARAWAQLGHMAMHDPWVRSVARATNASLTTGKRKPYGGHFWLAHPERFPRVPRDTIMMRGFEFQLVACVPSLNVVIVQLAVTRGDVVAPVEGDLDAFVGNVLDALR